MPAYTSFWNRIGTIFRRTHANGFDSGAATAALDSSKGAGEPADGHNAEAAGSQGGRIPQPRTLATRVNDPLDARPRSLLRWGRRDAKRESYERVTALMDAMTTHFERQDRRAEELSQAITRMAGILEQLPDVQRNHADCMGSIAAHLDTANRHSSELRETLARVPSSIQAQAEAIRSVTRQLEAAAQSDAQLVVSLDRLGQLTGTLSEGTHAQVEALRTIQAENNEQRQALTALVQQQGQRFLITMIAAALLTLGALGAIAVAAWMMLAR